MENKLTWVELKKIVSRQTNLTDKEVNLILTKWLDEMVAALKRGDELHINGLGTFKMKTMKPRKSVDVTTGQAIILPETDRLTFTMATGLEQLLSDTKPAQLEVGKDPIQKLSDQADEILDILGEMGQGPKKEQKVEEPEIEPEIEPQPKPEPEPEPEKTSEPDKPSEPDTPPKKQHLWLTALITILVFIALLIGLFFYFQHKFEQWLDNLREQVETMEEVIPDDMTQPTDTLVLNVSTDSIDSTTIDQPDTTTVVNNYRVYTEFIGGEQMHQDSRLAWMAYRYYGNKKLWVFIYDANKDHISDPERIAVGTYIRIPKLSQEILNYGEDIQILVEQMYQEFLGRNS